MTFDKFEYLISLYGAKIDTWPEDTQTSVTQFLLTSPAAQALMLETLTLDAQIYKISKPDFALGPMSAKIQQKFHKRKENRWLALLTSTKGITAIGSIGGLSGGLLAFILPLAVDGSILLTFAIGGIAP